MKYGEYDDKDDYDTNQGSTDGEVDNNDDEGDKNRLIFFFFF